MNYVQANPQRIPYWLEECKAAVELGHAEDARSAAVIVCRMTAELHNAPNLNAIQTQDKAQTSFDPTTCKCECSDPACPECQGNCSQQAAEILYRVDMDDYTGTAFCDQCSADAMHSGLFGDQPAADE